MLNLLLPFFMFTQVAAQEIKVLVIDTGISRHSKLTNVQYSNTYDYVDVNGHGTHITGLIQLGKDLNDQVCSNVKIYACKFYEKNVLNLDGITKCMRRAQAEHFDYVNISAGGPVKLLAEYRAFKNYKGIVYAAAGNDGQVLNESYQFFPASYSYITDTYLEGQQFKSVTPIDNIRVVEAICDGGICPYSNRYPQAIHASGNLVRSTLPNNKYGYMRGTSQATALALHEELIQRCMKFKGARNDN